MSLLREALFMGGVGIGQTNVYIRMVNDPWIK